MTNQFFEGVMEQTIACETCSSQSASVENFVDFGLNFDSAAKDKHELEKMLD